MYSGIEVDMLSLGDADSIIVTQYVSGIPHRILIDGGQESSAEVVLDFMRNRDATDFDSAVCTHAHKDHARGLIKIVQDKRITIHTAHLNDIRYYITPDKLRRASGSDGVKEVVETTKELSAALAARNVPIYRGLAGDHVQTWPKATVLGPSLDFYTSTLEEFTKVDLPIPAPFSSLASIMAGEAGSTSGLSGLRAPYANAFLARDRWSLVAGALSTSSVKEEPKTQPFNNTSMILGVEFEGSRFLFTADAGSDALDRIPPEWSNLAWMQVPHHGSDGNLSQTNIERFCPKFAYISACGDSSHPSRAVVNGLIKVGGQVCSTHRNGHMWFRIGTVPPRVGYSEMQWEKATGDQKPIDWAALFTGAR